MLQYREHDVQGVLATYVKKLWILDNNLNPDTVKGKTVLPNGCFNVALVGGEGTEVTTCKSVFTLKQGLYFCGQMTKAVLVDIKPFTKISIIQLHPWTPSSLSGTDMSQFRDEIVELSTIEYQLGGSVMESAFTDEASLLSLLQERILIWSKNAAEDSLVKESCKFVLETHGNLSVRELTEQAGVSERLLQKRFKHAVGISPKEYLKIIKLRDAVDQLAYPAADCPRGTDVALDSEYYDQAHFIHTFRSIIRTTPKKFSPQDYLLSFRKM